MVFLATSGGEMGIRKKGFIGLARIICVSKNGRGLGISKHAEV